MSRYARDTIWLISEKLLRFSLAFFVSIFLAKYLGPSDYGILNFSISVISVLVALSTFGIHNFLAKEIIENHERRGIIIGSSLTLSAFFSVLGFVTINTLSSSFISESVEPIVLIISFSLFFQPLFLLSFYFQAEIKNHFVAVSNIIMLLTTSSLKVVCIYYKQSLEVFAFIIVLESTIAYLFYSFFFLSIESYRILKVEWSEIRRLIILGAPLLLSGISHIIFSHSDKIMLQYLLSSESVGLYTVSYKIVIVWNFIPLVIADVFFPALIKVKLKHKVFAEKYNLVFSLIFVPLLIFTSLVSFFSNEIINILLGEKYLESGPILRFLVWTSFFSALGILQTRYLIAYNRGRTVLFLTLSGALINVVINFIAIPIFGVLGAVYASIISLALSNLVLSGVFKSGNEIFKININAILRILTFRSLKDLYVVFKSKGEIFDA